MIVRYRGGPVRHYDAFVPELLRTDGVDEQPFYGAAWTICAEHDRCVAASCSIAMLKAFIALNET